MKTPMEHWIGEGIRLLKSGRRQEAERALRIAVSENERSVEGWLWLSQAVESDGEKLTCLLKATALDPRNAVARQQLNSLQQHGQNKEAAYVNPFMVEEPAGTLSVPPSSVSRESLFPADSEGELKVKSRSMVRAVDFGRILLIGLIILVVGVVVAALFLLIR